MSWKSIGFFGGTFDPIHNGHLNLATHILKMCHLDHVFFSPANISPEKKGKQPNASKQDRKKMIELAIEGYPEFSVIDLELKREGPSYTIDTIKMLMEQYPGVQFHLILGEDILEGLSKWKEIEALLELAPPLVGTRPGVNIPRLPLSIREKIKAGETPISPLEISSTELRKRLSQKKDCTDLLPPKVLDYIHDKRIY